MKIPEGLIKELLNTMEWCYILQEDTGQIIYANQNFIDRFGEQSLGSIYEETFAGSSLLRLFKAERPECGLLCWELADMEENVYLMIRNRWVERKEITYRIGVIFSSNDLSGISREMAELTVQYRSLSEEKQNLSNELVWMAYHDYLTRLGNRNKFLKDSDELFEVEQTLGVINLDINNLKWINDNYGHVAGDTAINQIAAALLSVEEENRTFCYRVGGDEFLVVRIGCDGAYLETASAQIQEYMSWSRTEGITACEIAIGSALQEPGMDFVMLQRLADERMYAEKKMMKQIKVTNVTEAESHDNS